VGECEGAQRSDRRRSCGCDVQLAIEAPGMQGFSNPQPSDQLLRRTRWSTMQGLKEEAMADPPVTKKDLDALSKKVDDLHKQIDEVRKWFQDEKKWTHDELDLRKKWFDDEKAITRKAFEQINKGFEDTNKRIESLEKH
jgi:hypothetical protein